MSTKEVTSVVYIKRQALEDLKWPVRAAWLTVPSRQTVWQLLNPVNLDGQKCLESISPNS